MRLQNKIAIVVGAGQGPGTGMGNGRATVIRFAQEGAKVRCVDKHLKSGVILGISSLAAWEKYPYVAYKASKAAMVTYCQQIAIQNAEYGIRCNVILPGLMDTPMAVDTRARTMNKSRAEVAAMRDARVPLRKK